MNLEKGGRGAIERMVEAYGFKTRQALCDHLGISKSTLATRYMRDSFPAEWVIQCSLETGTSLNWLTTGEGQAQSSHSETIVRLEKHVLHDGKMINEGWFIFDKALFPIEFKNPLLVRDGNNLYVLEQLFNELSDGKWLISFDDKIYIRDLARMPGNNIRVANDTLSFDCKLNDIDVIAQVKITMSW